MMTDVMQERTDVLGSEWKDEGGGYYSLTGQSPATRLPSAERFASLLGSGGLAYVAVPENHPLAGRDYDGLPDGGPEVNGGLTFGNGNVYGWDYMHAYNNDDPEGDIQRALEYFRNHSAVEAA